MSLPARAKVLDRMMSELEDYIQDAGINVTSDKIIELEGKTKVVKQVAYKLMRESEEASDTDSHDIAVTAFYRCKELLDMMRGGEAS